MTSVRILPLSRVALIAIFLLSCWALILCRDHFSFVSPVIRPLSSGGSDREPPQSSYAGSPPSQPHGLCADDLLPSSNLHFLVPASSPNPNLCKLLASSAILGYPSPAILNWGQVFDKPRLVEGGSHLAKIQGAYDYVANLDASKDDDLVLMLDGHDVWLQLRPQVLIDRYFEIIRRSDARLRSDLGDVVVQRNVSNHVVFGCQKRCWPWTFDDPPCYAAESSSLAEDIYGPDTDTLLEGAENPYIRYRQRFLNSGVMMGPVWAMRRMFERAQQMVRTEPNIGSDQYIFNHILGDQQMCRELLRDDPSESVRKIDERNAKDMHPPSEATVLQHLNEVKAKVATRGQSELDFGITLDHGSELGLNTVFAEDDTEWLHFYDAAQLESVQNQRGIITSHRRCNHIADDIMRSLPPFWTFSEEPPEILPEHSRDRTWDQMSLFTDIWTGITPVAIHHNAHRDGMKSLRETMWPMIWFNGYTRALYDISVYTPFIPLAVSGYNASSCREWWPYEPWKGGARRPSFGPTFFRDGWLPFNTVCVDHHLEVFRDSYGPWKLPENH